MPAPESVTRYLSPRAWLRGLVGTWLHVCTGCILTWITSNGIEATAQSCPWKLVALAFVGVGTTWKQAIIQAAVHATYSAVRYINAGTPSRPPFRETFRP